MLSTLWFTFLDGACMVLCCYAWAKEPPAMQRKLLPLLKLALGALGLGLGLLWLGGCA